MVHQIYHHQRTLSLERSHHGRDQQIKENARRITVKKSSFESVRHSNYHRKEQGVSHMEQKLYSLNEKCLSLMKENNELTTKLKKV